MTADELADVGEVGEQDRGLVICRCGRVVVEPAGLPWSQWARPPVECKCDPAKVARRERARLVRAFAHGVRLAKRPKSSRG